MLLSALLFLGHLTITAWSQSSSVKATTLLSQPQSQSPAINGQAIPLSTGGYVVFLLNNNYVATPSTPLNDNKLLPQRIVGGHKIAIGQAPWQISLHESGRFICGGSILTRYWILTAAHCVENRGKYYIRAGSTLYRRGGQAKRIRKIIVHAKYNPRTQNNDIALIKLRSPLNFGRKVRPVKLANSGARAPRHYFVTGWGIKSENAINPSKVLRRVEVKSVSRRTCSRLYANRVIITNKMICAASPNKDSCSGDSGGPLVLNGRQYGIVSFGVGCARARSPGVYTDVRKFRKFISYVMRRY